MKKIQLYLYAAIAIVLGYIGAGKYYDWQLKSKATLIVPSLEKELSHLQGEKEEMLLLLVDVKGAPAGLSSCLSSIETQKYKNFEVLFLATDLTAEAEQTLTSFLKKSGIKATLTSANRGDKEKLLWSKIFQLNDRAVVATLNANNWLANDYIFKLLNHHQRKNGFELLLGQYIHYPSYEQGILSKRTRHCVNEKRFPLDPTLLASFKAFRADFLKAHPDVKLLSLNKEKRLKDLFNQAKQPFFCRDVLEIKNEKGFSDPLLFNTPKSL